MVTTGVDVVEDGHRKTRETVHVHLIRSETGCSTNRVVVGELDVGQVEIPIILTFVDDHGEHLSHGVIDAFDPTIAIWMIGAGSDLAHPEAFEEGD